MSEGNRGRESYEVTLLSYAAVVRRQVWLIVGFFVVAVVVLLAVVLLAVRPPRSVPAAAVRAATVFVVAMALVPAGRIGYVVYPIDLLAWAWLAQSSVRRRPHAVPEEPMTGLTSAPTG